MANDPNNDNFIMPVGKEHKGKRLIDIPIKYLDWIIGEDWLWASTKAAIEQHLRTTRKDEWDAFLEE